MIPASWNQQYDAILAEAQALLVWAENVPTEAEYESRLLEIQPKRAEIHARLDALRNRMKPRVSAAAAWRAA